MQLFTDLQHLSVGKSTDVIFLCMFKEKFFSVSWLMQMQTKALFCLCPFESGLAAPLSIRQDVKTGKNPHGGNRDPKQSFHPATNLLQFPSTVLMGGNIFLHPCSFRANKSNANYCRGKRKSIHL